MNQAGWRYAVLLWYHAIVIGYILGYIFIIMMPHLSEIHVYELRN